MDVFEAIHGRRSPGSWCNETLPTDVLEKLIESAVTAPNHHNTEPWRFFILTGTARENFGNVLADAAIRKNPDLDVEKLKAIAGAERAKPLRAPALIVVACKHSDNPRVLPVEDLHACAAATQNILLAAHGLGLAAAWKTGDGISDFMVKAHFGLDKDDCIVGVVYLGFPGGGAGAALKPRQRATSTVTEWRN